MAENVVTIVGRDLDGDTGKRDLKLLDRAQKGDDKALFELKDRHGNRPGFWKEVGDYSRHLEQHMAKQLTGDNGLIREGILRKLESMRQELTGPNPSALEELLAERVATCWLQLQLAESRATTTGLTLTLADHYQKQADRAHRRYLAAIKTLATVRRLQIPPMQVNIAEKQVNLLG